MSESGTKSTYAPCVSYTESVPRTYVILLGRRPRAHVVVDENRNSALFGNKFSPVSLAVTEAQQVDQ
jgi:hypothetical protein